MAFASTSLRSLVSRKLITPAASRALLFQRRAATTSAALPPQAQAPQVVPTEEEMAADPQLAGLGYPQVPQVSRQLRPAKKGWWDEQERIQFGEVLPESDDALSMWAPDVHKIPATRALAHLSIAAGCIAAFAGFIYLNQAEVPAAKREYPYDGLVKELSGTDDQAYAAVIKGSSPKGEEDDE